MADGLDYFAALLFSTPLIGDIFDFIVTSLLYSITRSKLSTAINMTEFIPFVGDLIPVYILSTLVYISKGIRKPKGTHHKGRYGYHVKRVVRDLVGALMRRKT
jgi:hypothetical protein